jgi:hypothetical protein
MIHSENHKSTTIMYSQISFLSWTATAFFQTSKCQTRFLASFARFNVARLGTEAFLAHRGHLVLRQTGMDTLDVMRGVAIKLRHDSRLINDAISAVFIAGKVGDGKGTRSDPSDLSALFSC